MNRVAGISVRLDQWRTKSMMESRGSWGTQAQGRVPLDLFLFDMFFYQFGDDFVLALELVAQGGDDSLEVVLGRGVLALEGGGAVLEELLLPEVEERGRELVLVAEV